MSLYYLILWNQVDILQKHFRKDHVHICASGRGFTLCGSENLVISETYVVLEFTTFSLQNCEIELIFLYASHHSLLAYVHARSVIIENDAQFFYLLSHKYEMPWQPFLSYLCNFCFPAWVQLSIQWVCKFWVHPSTHHHRILKLECMLISYNN